MRTFVTADLHLGHGNIIQYTGRPFRHVDDMNRELIRRWNQRVKPEDMVYHLGDFCFRGGSEGSRTTAQDWEKKLSGKLIHIVGNHDTNNRVKGLDMGVISFADRRIKLIHIPPYDGLGVEEYDLILCGHVHEKWKYMYIKDTYVINVGVDQWRFMPVTLEEITVYHDRLIKEGPNAEVQGQVADEKARVETGESN